MNDANPGATVGVEALLNLTGTDKSAKAYAFLYASFRRTEVSTNPVRDAMDCLTPFIIPYINSIAGKQVTPDGVKGYLKANFDFDIPAYAIEQFIPGLQRTGHVKFNKLTRAHVAQHVPDGFEVARAEIETDFEDVVRELSKYAAMASSRDKRG
jgi:hypothetical protein